MKMSGNDKYEIEYLESVSAEDIQDLPASAKKTIKKAIEECLTIDPIGFGKPLRYSLKGHRRLSVSSYRVIYRIIANSRTVLTVAVKHRKEVYED
jgi:mRNA interferase RelE/StbE